MAVLKRREYVFREKPRRGRMALLILLLGATTLTAAAFGDGIARQTLDSESLDRLTAPPGPMRTDRVGGEGARVYGALGGPEQFVLELTDRGAFLRFLCKEAKGECREEGGTIGRPVVRLEKVTGSRGDTIYKDAEGDAVLRLAVTGGATLLAGSKSVPDSVPLTGRAVLPTNKSVASLAPLAGSGERS